eukprot:TRINITY_DN11268_c0_g1_i1.p1 TRINITY_DN11268_c0_g1~~TRINITY_DN11268_c0_g1_i1.p1  ORF type:complete len:628 (+),score=281.02 TRINITY_DN11268_c0_g1_i1:54-1886(+)
MAVADYQSLIDSFVAPWAKSSDCWQGGAAYGDLVLKAFNAQKAFIATAVAMKKPNEEKFGEMLGATSELMGEMAEQNEGNQRNRDTALHSKTVAEGIQILAWVTVDKTPVPFCQETIASCMYSGNKVLMEQKGKDDKQVQWVKDFKAILEEVQKYVKQHHTTGVAWGSTSGEAQEADSSAPTGGNSVQAYDEFLESVAPLVKASEALSPEVAAAAGSLQDAFLAQRAFLSQVEVHSKPSDDVFSASLGPQIEKMSEVSEKCSAIKDRDFTQHSKALEDGAQLIAWVSVPTTVPHVTEQTTQVTFYINKILMAHKGDDNHKAWCDAYKALCAALTTYVKQEHKTGLAWKGGAPPLKADSIPAAPAAPKSEANVVKASGESKDSALFSEISKGTDISKGLKKVTDDQKVHKNRKEGESKPIDVEELEKKKAALAEAQAARAKKQGWPSGEAKTELEGKKWVVEYHLGTRLEQKNLEIEGDKSQSVYIYGCQNVFIQIKGKVNAITLDKCKKTQVSFESIIGSLEVTSCEGCEVQTTGCLPAASIDKTKEFMLYLSRDSLEAEITTSACTCINVTLPGKTDEDDPIEMNIPEQFISRVAKGNKISTVPMAHSG